MFAMILAAGRGVRMRPLTDTLPKPLLSVNDKPLIEYHLDKFQAMGLENIIINQAWLGHLLPQTLGNGSRWHLKIAYSDEKNNALETAGGIKKALTKIDGDYFLVVNGDIWTDFDFSVLPESLATGVLAHVVLVDNPEHNLQGDFAIKSGVLKNTGKTKFTFSGIAIYHRAFFHDLELEISALGPLLRRFADAGQISAEHYSGQWFDIGTPQRLHELDQKLRHTDVQ